MTSADMNHVRVASLPIKDLEELALSEKAQRSLDLQGVFELWSRLYECFLDNYRSESLDIYGALILNRSSNFLTFVQSLVSKGYKCPGLDRLYLSLQCSTESIDMRLPILTVLARIIAELEPESKHKRNAVIHWYLVSMSYGRVCPEITFYVDKFWLKLLLLASSMMAKTPLLRHEETAALLNYHLPCGSYDDPSEQDKAILKLHAQTWNNDPPSELEVIQQQVLESSDSHPSSEAWIATSMLNIAAIMGYGDTDNPLQALHLGWSTGHSTAPLACHITFWADCLNHIMSKDSHGKGHRWDYSILYVYIAMSWVLWLSNVDIENDESHQTRLILEIMQKVPWENLVQFLNDSSQLQDDVLSLSEADLQHYIEINQKAPDPVFAIVESTCWAPRCLNKQQVLDAVQESVQDGVPRLQIVCRKLASKPNLGVDIDFDVSSRCFQLKDTIHLRAMAATAYSTGNKIQQD